LSKAGIQATLNARASILASCLPKNTYYEPTQPLHKNCDLSPPIMSRFDLMFVMQDVHDETNDNVVAWHILQLHRQCESEVETKVLSQLELQRYIRLARTYKPRVTPEAHQRLVQCYRKLREDRTYVRGACGVTVRQLESLIRLSEAIARVHLSDKITADFVTQAFELQLGSLKRAERENIDLENPDAMAPVDEAAPAEPQAAAAAAAAAPAKPKRAKISYHEYQRIGHMLTKYLYDKEQANEEVKEEDLIAWYMETVEEDIQNEAQLVDQQQMVQLIINRLIDKDRVILVYRASDNALRPEGRVLIKHPNFPVGDRISS